MTNIPWNEPHRLTYLGRKIHLCVPAPFNGYMDVVVDGGLNSNLTVMRFPSCGKGLKVLPDEPAAPAFDPSNDWEYRGQIFGEWHPKNEFMTYHGQMVDGRHVVGWRGSDTRFLPADHVRNIEPKPEPAPDDFSAVVAYAVMYRDRLGFALFSQSKDRAQDYADGIGGTVRPLTFADTAKPKGKSLGWLNVFRYPPSGMIATSNIYHTRAHADRDAVSDPYRRIACVEIFEGEGL